MSVQTRLYWKELCHARSTVSNRILCSGLVVSTQVSIIVTRQHISILCLSSESIRRSMWHHSWCLSTKRSLSQWWIMPTNITTRSSLLSLQKWLSWRTLWDKSNENPIIEHRLYCIRRSHHSILWDRFCLSQANIRLRRSAQTHAPINYKCLWWHHWSRNHYRQTVQFLSSIISWSLSTGSHTKYNICWWNNKNLWSKPLQTHPHVLER